MRNPFLTDIVRRRAVVTAAGIAAVGALAVPGIAWANDAVPEERAAVVSAAAGQTFDPPSCAPGAEKVTEMKTLSEEEMKTEVKALSEEEMQRMLADGTIQPATGLVAAQKIGDVVSTGTDESTPADTITLSEVEVQRMLADGTIQPATATVSC